jgi:hypothetical protein
MPPHETPMIKKKCMDHWSMELSMITLIGDALKYIWTSNIVDFIVQSITRRESHHFIKTLLDFPISF